MLEPEEYTKKQEYYKEYDRQRDQSEKRTSMHKSVDEKRDKTQKRKAMHKVVERPSLQLLDSLLQETDEGVLLTVLCK